MSRMKGYLGAMLPLAMMLNEINRIDENIYLEEKPSNKLKPDGIIIDEWQKKPAKGCKEYFFNKHGDFYSRPMLKTETIFYCHAINDNSAKKKFKRWQLNEVV